MTESMETAVRMVGQLLLHRPTTGGMFRTTNGELVTPLTTTWDSIPKDTCAFCYVGAIRATAVVLGLDQEDLWNACDKHVTTDSSIEGDDWDQADEDKQESIAFKLCTYKEKK